MTWNKAPANGGAATAVDIDGSDTGHARLRELGYKQELKRDLSYVAPNQSLTGLSLFFLGWFLGFSPSSLDG